MQVRLKITFPDTMTHILSESNTSFHAKYCKTNKVYFLFFRSFLLLLTKLPFCKEDLALGYHSSKFRQFSHISEFPKLLSLKSFSNS